MSKQDSLKTAHELLESDVSGKNLILGPVQ